MVPTAARLHPPFLSNAHRMLSAESILGAAMGYAFPVRSLLSLPANLILTARTIKFVRVASVYLEAMLLGCRIIELLEAPVNLNDQPELASCETPNLVGLASLFYDLTRVFYDLTINDFL